MPTFDEIERAYFFVSGSHYGENTAILRRSTGEIVYHSDMDDLGEISEDELENLDPADSVEIPHKNDLDLGKQLVFAFTAQRLPDQLDRVIDIFSSRGAYARFKDLLEFKGLLDAWYEFEAKHEEETLRQWCADNNITLTD